MLDRVSEQQTTAIGAGADAQAVEQLRQQIEIHEKADASRSALKRVVGSVSSLFVKDDTSLEGLRSAYLSQQQNLKDGKAVDTAEVQALIKKDRDATETQSEVVHYGSQFLKTAGLFMRGRFGLASTVGLYALDQIRPGDSFKDQLIDATLGAAKGGLMKGTFALMGDKPVGIAAKGVGLGVSSRILEHGLTRQTYMDPTTGEFSLGKGLTDTLHASLNKTALATDVVIFGAAHGLLRGANSATLGRIDKSPMLTTMLTGTTFGLSAGATGEILRQNAAGEQFDLSKIVKRSLIQGALDTAAAAPGGVQADPHVQGRIRNITRSGLDNMRSQVDGLKTSFLNLADSIPMTLNGGMVPEFAGAPGVRLDMPVPRPERVTKPGRDPKLDGIMLMEGPTGSGANIDSLLGSPPRENAGARTGDKSTPEPVGERSLLGDRKVEVNSAIRVRTADEKVAFERFEDLAAAAASAEGGAKGKQELFQFLRQHPELEIPILQYEGMLVESVSGYKPGAMTPTELQQRMDIVSMLGEFYKPDRARVFVANQEQAQALGEVIQLLRGLRAEGAAAVIARQGLFEFLSKHPEIHDVVRRYGASSNDSRAVTVLDQYFGTNHIAGLRQLLAWRENPLAQPTASPVDTSAKGPEIVADSPKPVVEGQLPVDGQQKVDQPAPAEGTGEKSVFSPPPPPVVRAEDGANSGLGALSRAKPLSLVAEGGEAVASEYSAVAPAVERRDATATPPPAPEVRDAAPPPARPAASPEAARGSVTASDYAKGLSDPSPAVRTKTARVLADHLDKLTDAEFTTWRQVAPDAILLGSSLNRPDVANLPPAVLKRFLSKQTTAVETAPPEWAAEHVERARIAAEQRAAASDRPPRPPREKKDTIEMRIDLLEKALNTFKDSPETAARLVALGAQDRGALESVIFSLGHPKFGEAYKSLLKQVMPHVESADALKYLFQFIKQNDTEGVFAALQQIKPKAQGSVEEIERQLQAERSAQPAKTYEQMLDEVTAEVQEREGAYDATKVVLEADQRFAAQEQAQQADLRPEAERLFQARQATADQQWQAIQRLVHDIMTGNIQAPRQSFGGRGGGGGDRRGGRGPGGGDRGGSR